MNAWCRLRIGVLLVLGPIAVTISGQGPSRGTQPSALPVQFTVRTQEAGLDFVHMNGASPFKHLEETMGAGGALLDVDNDGWLDIFLVDSGSIADPRQGARARHRLYRNRGDGTFEDISARAGLTRRGYGMGACAADYDNDGAMDIYVTGAGQNTLYRGNGRGVFTDVTDKARVGSARFATSCTFVDLDRDGNLDLFITNYVDTSRDVFCGDLMGRGRAYCHPLNYRPETDVLFRNNGDGTFTDVSRAWGVVDHQGNGLGVVATDYDQDGWPDLFVANDGVPNFLYHNMKGARFEETALLAGVSVAVDGRPRSGMGTDAGDVDGDGLIDLFVTNFEFQSHTLFKNLGRGLFVDTTLESGLRQATRPFVGFGTNFADVDNDGDLDLAIVNGHVLDVPDASYPKAVYAQRKLLLRNDGRGRFEDVSKRAGPGFLMERVGRALLAGDLDNDGDIDFVVTNNGQGVDLLRNDGGNAGRGVMVDLVGRSSNREGIGARIELTVGKTRQVREVRAGSGYLGSNDRRAHFGVGDAATIDRLTVTWPSGGVDVVERVATNQLLTIVEGRGLQQQLPFRVK